MKALVALGWHSVVDQWWTNSRRYCRDQRYLPQVSTLAGSWFSSKWALHYSTSPVYRMLKALYNTCHIHPFTYIQALMAEAVMQRASCSSGAIWGSLSFFFLWCCHNNSASADAGQNDTTLQFAPRLSRCRQQRHQLPFVSSNDDWHYVIQTLVPHWYAL